MSSLLALLKQQTPNLQTRKGLLVLGLQNDFISSDGKLPVCGTAFLDNLTELVSAFREHGNGHVFWVRSEYQQNRSVNDFDSPGDTVITSDSSGVDAALSSTDNEEDDDVSSDREKSDESSVTSPEVDASHDDEEMFLTRTPTREPCCIRGSHGAEPVDRIRPLINPDKDVQITTTHYSAFDSTSLLLTLRSKLVTELYLCGCITNLSVYATAMDASRYGIGITLVDDCLGYRKLDRHQMALARLIDLMDAHTMTGAQVADHLQNPGEEYGRDGEDDESDDSEDEAENTSQRYQDQFPNGGTGLNVESETESGDKAILSTARSTKLLDKRFDLRKAEEPRIYSSPHAQPLSPSFDSRGQSRQIWQPAKSTSNGVKPRIHAPASHGKSRAVRESPRNLAPWLDIIRPERSAQFKDNPKPLPRPSHPGLAALCSAAGLDQRTILEYEKMMKQARDDHATMNTPASIEPLFGKDKAEESENSKLLRGLLHEDFAGSVFDDLNKEIDWHTMYHQTGEVPRLVCCQATVDQDGSMPVYRHPADQTLPTQPWTPIVDRVRKVAEQAVGHTLNHALIQLYRGGNDFISEHSDKSLDIAPGSNIVNVSFGAQRTMRLRTKRGAAATLGEERTTYRVPMPHNSMLIMSLETNAQYLHGIKWDRRPPVELSEAERAYAGHRISLTFRNIGTFLSGDSSSIWGQGAIGKTKAEARPVVNGDPTMSEELIVAFGRENAASHIEWQEIYGRGFDVLHLK